MSAAAPATTASSSDKPIYLVSYPKIILLYPTFFASLLAGILSLFLSDAWKFDLAIIFLTILGLNLVVLSFDFPRTTSLTLFFLIVAIGLGLTLLFRMNPDVLPAIHHILAQLKPMANETFYFCFAAMLGIIYTIVLINARFDYWEVRPNELLHHHGFLSNLERFSAPNLRISKEVNDVFEYFLLGSGRLIIHPSTEPRAFVLENVPMIDAKERRITRMLGALQVQVRDSRTDE